MKKIILHFMFFCFVLFALLFNINTEYVIAQSNNYLDFLPLQVGNVWVYKWKLYVFMPPVNDSGFHKVIVNNSVLRNNKIYYIFSTYSSGGCSAAFGNIFANNILRVDSLSGNVMKFDSVNYCSYSPYEKLIDSLKIRLHDSINYNCQTTNYRPFCNDTVLQNIFGSSRPSKSVLLPEIEAANNKRFVNGIGISEFGYNSSHLYQEYHCNYIIKGCVINGIVYGDTSMIVGINKISNEVPSEYTLYQNYPNPFNPVTKIKFSLPRPSEGGEWKVQLLIYDVLGREVASLIPSLWGGQSVRTPTEEGLQPGTYEVEWDGSNYSSGVYFYQIKTDSFNETKRMVLIK